jgi:FkbM family methyltransferase
MRIDKFRKEAQSAKWDVYAFEANPLFNSDLEKVKALVAKNHSVYIFNETAAWTHDGKIDFYLDTGHFWGSSLDKNHPDVIRSGRKKLTVSCKDISRILKQYKENDLVVMKIDIEGAEYDLLLDFMKKDVFKLIDYLAVEFYPEAVPFSSIDNVFMEIMKLYGTKLIKLHSNSIFSLFKAQ